jgi:hypothetical protein
VWTARQGLETNLAKALPQKTHDPFCILACNNFSACLLHFSSLFMATAIGMRKTKPKRNENDIIIMGGRSTTTTTTPVFIYGWVLEKKRHSGAASFWKGHSKTKWNEKWGFWTATKVVKRSRFGFANGTRWSNQDGRCIPLYRWVVFPHSPQAKDLLLRCNLSRFLNTHFSVSEEEMMRRQSGPY